jgi:hypothetical protein
LFVKAIAKHVASSHLGFKHKSELVLFYVVSLKVAKASRFGLKAYLHVQFCSKLARFSEYIFLINLPHAKPATYGSFTRETLFRIQLVHVLKKCGKIRVLTIWENTFNYCK